MHATDQIRLAKRGLEKLLDEEHAFLKQREQLRLEYPCKFVAVHEGRVVDSDADEFELARRLMRNYPSEDILIRSVEHEDEPGEMLSPMSADDV